MKFWIIKTKQVTYMVVCCLKSLWQLISVLKIIKACSIFGCFWLWNIFLLYFRWVFFLAWIILFYCNFRLFLTMDPKFGEISRAMRNRGVEIYIPGEVGTSTYYLVVISMLWKKTNHLNHLIQTIINCNNYVYNMIPCVHVEYFYWVFVVWLFT